MKTWKNPDMEELSIICTEQGKCLNKQYDEIRVDQNGNYWQGFGSGADSNPDTHGNVEVIDP